MLDEVKAWQTRPLEELYPILYLDALVIKVRDGHQVRNKAAHIAVGVDLDGIKHVLGIWVQASEGAKFWAGVCAELRNRGIRDVLIVCCDGLSGFPEAIEATWPHSIVQTCTVHLIRAAMRFVSYQDRKKVAGALRPIYTAPTIDAAESELLAFYELPREHWSKLRSTNPLERVNREIGRRTDVVGISPNDAALLRLAVALLIEQNDEWLIARRYLSQESLELVLADEPATKEATQPTPALSHPRRSSATPRHTT